MELLIDATIGYGALSLDRYSSYNQIWMHPDDAEMMAFRSKGYSTIRTCRSA